MLKEIQILVEDHGLPDLVNLWITGYKVVKGTQYVLFFSELRIDAAYFDEDDYIIELSKNKFNKLQIFEFEPEDEPKETKLETPIEINL
jgi:hypothetical protein